MEGAFFFKGNRRYVGIYLSGIYQYSLEKGKIFYYGRN